MVLTKEQLSELICKHSERENGLQDLLEERREYLRENSASGNKCNGFRPGHSYGHGRTLTFRIPRDRYGNFHPRILAILRHQDRYGNFHPRILAILRHQEDECERLAGTLYTKGLTQEQVGEVFQDIYGEHYSKASISRTMASTTARRAFRGCWTTFVKMFRNGSRALWRLITPSSSSIAYT